MLKPIRKTYLLFVLFLLSISCGYNSNEAVTFYKNGYIFNGKTFEKKNFFVKDGRFTFNSLTHANKVVDLEEMYVIPPFGDAHTHNLDDVEQFDSIYKAYINEGTFYVQVLTNHYSSYQKIKDSVNSHGKIDVTFAHGGITSTGGHPHALYETRSMGLGWQAMLMPENKEKIRNARNENKDAYYLMDNLKDVHNQWDEMLSKHPDILKIYISDFENRDAEIEAGNVGTYGLTRDVSKRIIERAKESGITLYAHIESVDDFTWAINNGVTHFAHMPGYGGGFGRKDLEQFVIPDSTLQKAAKHNVVITPTVSFTKYYSQTWNGNGMALDSLLFEEKKTFLKKQLRRMYDSGIHIALGADQNGSTLMEEVDDIIALDEFNNEELLDILINTSKQIFPNRNIGEIKEGYEASFLVLNNNPIEDIGNIKDIGLRVKNGITLESKN